MNGNEINTVLISNVIFEPYMKERLDAAFKRNGSSVQLSYVAYEETLDNALSHVFADQDIVIVALNFEVFYPNLLNDLYSNRVTLEEIRNDALRKCQELFYGLKIQKCVHVIWFSFEDYCYKYHQVLGSIGTAQGIVDSINMEVNRFVSDECVFVDLKRLIAEVGIHQAYSSKGRYRWNAPYSKELITAVCEEVNKQYLIYTGISKKCLVLDCDNVLWGGILSEDGIEKIRIGDGLGKAYQDFQRFLLTLYYHGVILTICSKNDEADVIEVFRKHSGMILKEEHIACFKVNWDNKPENIQKIAEELNIGLDSMVFVDDSEFEIQSVRELLPEVTAILYERDTIYSKLSLFNLKSDIEKDKVKLRTETYRTNAQRRILQNTSASYEEYLKSLEINVDIHPALLAELARITELNQRTNKCTNGIRYTVDQLFAKLQNGNYKLYSVYVSDRFSDLGLVGAIGISGNVLDLFSLSCRSLGRGVESMMMSFVKNNEVLEYRFVPTIKNRKIREDLFENFLSEKGTNLTKQGFSVVRKEDE